MIKNKLSLKNKSKIFKASLETKTSPIPERWSDFAPLTKIRSGNKIVPFIPYDYQIELVKQIETHPTTVVAKTRQLGISETIINFILHRAIKSQGYLAVVFSKNQSDTSNLAKRLRRSIESISHLTSLKTDSLTDLEFNNGGRILFRNSTPNGARGLESVSDILFDECAFVPEIEEIYSATIPTTTAVGDRARIILLSTPAGQNGFFWRVLSNNNRDRDLLKICEDIKNERIKPYQYWEDDNGWCKFLLHWKAHPIYFQKKDTYLNDIEKRFQLPKSVIEQEYNLSFTHSTSIVFPPELIRSVAIGKYDRTFKHEHYTYYMGIDTSLSVGKDYVVATVIRESKINGKLELIDLYRENSNTFLYHLNNIKTYMQKYYPIGVCIEITGAGGGQVYLETLQEDMPVYNYLAFKTTTSSKNNLINRTILYFEQGKFIIPNDPIIIDEYNNFRRIDNRLGASHGYNDDIVISIGLALEAIKLYEELFNKYRSNRF
ncbi:MAG: hypothetical protein QNJ54_22320 [Prochloraceae cyanobacterium]|nr:hypothetical protein [Prochloraceae cyanobacterium]